MMWLSSRPKRPLEGVTDVVLHRTGKEASVREEFTTRVRTFFLFCFLDGDIF